MPFGSSTLQRNRWRSIFDPLLERPRSAGRPKYVFNKDAEKVEAVQTVHRAGERAKYDKYEMERLVILARYIGMVLATAFFVFSSFFTLLGELCVR